MPDGRGGGDLTLVDTGILALGVSYPQGPLLGVGRVHGFEALIRGVRVPTDRQQVDVSMAHPGDLEW